ncbi:DUF4097 and DUF4098 domain-containing protein YvlB [Saccharothrix tamanrassetensis]|uniref:DUF4097 and DUF4098 domain-containing protein YvlB n=1 Tax=Saccharothrix tamanrassetensis TaxID=1051531 RepID=A0A841CHK6_9PSEU|nr:DUF4097 family beta strand repeat-containing protein [Saccharothrix tamanrassetensis]MBB5955668.1 DUF4097 and DUF4098 domain-containing protein YvlB [Saccharothrix tamanrassetensis]
MEGETVETEQVVRQQSFEVEGVVEIDVALLTGRVQVHLVDEPGVHVEVRHDASAGESWTAGLNNLLSWVNDQFGAGRGQPGGPAEAVRDARVELTGQRLRIQSSKSLPLRAVALGVTVRAPSGSHVITKSGAADVTVTGAAGRLEIQTGTGDVTADRADASSQVNSGSGKVRLGPMLGGLRAKTGSGDIEVSSVGGNTVLYTGTGDVWLGAVQNDVQVRTGGGDVTVADAASGRLQLGTGSGDVRVGVRPGVAAQVDLVSTSGTARSELAVSDTPPEGGTNLFVTGRTGTGNALVTASTS